MANFSYEVEDLFSLPQGYVLVHCISNDFALGAGIALEFDKRYNMRERLIDKYKDEDDQYEDKYVGKALQIDNVFNLVTKPRGYDTPNYHELKLALEDLASQVKENKIKKLGMPKIGAGLDKLEWTIVLSIIKSVFKDIDVDITICFLDGDEDFGSIEEQDAIKALNDYFLDD